MYPKNFDDYLTEDFKAIRTDPQKFLSTKEYSFLLHTIDTGYNETGKSICDDDIEIYLIPKYEKTEKFYDELNQNEDERELYLIFDRVHNYMDSNSNEFFLTCWLLKGITFEDVVDKPYLLVDYVLKVKSYLGFLD